ncbi:hypothetical protein [Nocardiopsis metallicus]|uniref:Uncharacterized protein n=1 Tax=Nocardiopsis metallicus TaxID=179819 RepID=A0A840W210_9ACTN|nr:hypothetical protein [Nocardiopsis metallicus]MBB5490910.1 hypothetical protein [Nocardiopsis metallicus]
MSDDSPTTASVKASESPEATETDAPARRPNLADRYHRGMDVLNVDRHRLCLQLYLVIVIAHWAEHIAQAVQIYVFDWPLAEARGVLGIPFPWLVTSEWMHYGYALIMLIGLLLLLPGFTGRARTWWTVSLLIQVWHHFEHLILLVQVSNGVHLGGGDAPSSLIQLLIPRVELHLFYNTLVFVPMAVAMYLHSRPNPAEREAMRCSCAGDPPRSGR